MKFVHISLGIFLITLSVVFSAIGYQSWGAIKAAKETAQSANNVLTKLDTTLDKINSPCVGFHGSVTCGTLAQIDQSIKNVGAMAAQSQQQVKQSAAVIVAIQEALVGIQNDVGKELGNLGGTTKELTKFLTVLNDPDTGVKPVLVATTKTVTDIDTSTKEISPEVVRSAKAFADVGEQSVIISTNTAKVTSHFEKIIDTPHKAGFWHTVVYWLQIAANVRQITN